MLGAPRGTTTSTSSRSLPALIAYYDFDNDDEVDTVLKYGFTEGYMRIRYGAPEESLAVWRSEVLPISLGDSLWSLLNETPSSRSAVRASGTYLPRHPGLPAGAG